MTEEAPSEESPDEAPRPSLIDRALSRIEAAGNALPHPTLLFLWMALGVLVLSWLLSLIGAAAEHPVSGETVSIVNLLSADGVRRMLTGTVTNFTSFAPLGTVLVAMLGIGIAERSGLLGALLRALVRAAPARALTFFVVLAGVLSSLAADAGYVVLIPLAAIVFHTAGRHPLAGIAAAFAGVSAGFSANLLVGPLDAILAGLSTSAAQLVAPDVLVNATGNYYFLIFSTFVIAGVATFVTEAIVERRLEPVSGTDIDGAPSPSDREGPALMRVTIFSVLFLLVCLAGLIPEGGFLRDPATGSIVQSPFISGSVVVVSLWAALAGVIFGRTTGAFGPSGDGAVSAMEKTMETMASYLVLMFFAAQFVAWFGWTNLGIIAAIQGSEVLRALGLGSIPLLMTFVVLAAMINLFVGSASAKWAIMAPVFVPMLMLVGISPEATQMAYRIGDSTTNIITPLMPYLGLVVAFAQRWDPRAGIGSIIAMMLPYSIVLFLVWTTLLGVWLLFGLPLGPGAGLAWPPAGG